MNIGQQFARFLVAGGIATALHYLILIILVQTRLTGALAASSIGFALSAVVNYLLNHRFTFASQRPHRQAAPRFAMIATTGLGINAALFWIFYSLGAQNYLLSQVMATGGTIVWNFALNRLWTFAHATSTATTDKESKL